MTKQELDQVVNRGKEALANIEQQIEELDAKIRDLRNEKQQAQNSERRLAGRSANDGLIGDPLLAGQLAKAVHTINDLEKRALKQEESQINDLKDRHGRLQAGLDKLIQLDAEVTKMLDSADSWYKDLQSLL